MSSRRGSGPVAGEWACDVSVALPALVSGHEAHRGARQVVVERRPALAGHAVVQLFSALTRLPLPDRVRPDVALDVIERAFPVWLDRQRSTRDVISALSNAGIGGVGVTDGLVGLSSAYVGATLLTRDARSARVYEALGVPFEIIGD